MLKKTFFKPVALTLLGLFLGTGLVAFTGGLGKLNLAFGSNEVALGGPLPSLPDGSAVEKINATFRSVAKAVQPTVVSITVKTEARRGSVNDENNPFHFFFRGPDGQEEMPYDFGPQSGLGSGVIISNDGYIITNNHVVENAAKKGGVTVKLHNRKEYPARVIGTDPTTDIAVLKIEASGLNVAALGNSDQVEVGDLVMAVGNPLGLTSTVTQGIVSSLGRGIGINADSKGYGIDNFIQTDAAINPGNSGGGLYNFKGQVVGINSAIATKTGMFQGYGFAIPINMARTVASDIIKYGRVNRGYIGVNIRSVDATEAEALGLGEPRGVRVADVVKGGGGEAAGLQKNDVILSIDGHEVNESNQLQGLIALRHAGDRVTLHIWREGKELDKVVTLKPREDDKDISAIVNSVDGAENEEVASKKESMKFDDIGLSVRNLTESEKDKFDTKGGVLITTVMSGSEASERGLGLYSQGGGPDFSFNGQRQANSQGVITQAAKKPIRNVDEFEDVLKANRGKSIALTVKDSKGDSRFFALKVPNN